MKTLREYLNLFGDPNNIQCSYPPALNVEIKSVEWLAFDNGSLQIYCGGLCIASFKPSRGFATYYLVVDDSEEKAWRSDPDRKGCCPAPKLKITIAV